MASRSMDAEGSSEEYSTRKNKEANSDEYEDPEDEDADVVVNDPFPSFKQNKEKKPQKHLWHAALALILERGRPVTRMSFVMLFLSELNLLTQLRRQSRCHLKPAVSAHGKH